MRALVLALNPAVDVEWRVPAVRWDEKNLIRVEQHWAGGKGVNVTRWLRHLGGQPRLLLPLGGRTGAELAGYLRAEKIPARILRLREPTRANVVVTTDSGRQLRFNYPGPKLTEADWRRIVATVTRSLRARARTQPGLLILSGSLPRGVPTTAYTQLIRLAHRFGVKSLLDCDGTAFAAAVRARPFLVKPNAHELAEWYGASVRTEGDLLRAARALSRQTHGWVLVSRGARRAVLIHDAKRVEYFATPRRIKPRNTVGAGDALLAAVAWQIGRGAEPFEWLRHGVRIGTRAARCRPGRVRP